jgi:hypothetical protein
VYLVTHYKHQPWNVKIDETLAKVKAPKLEIVAWTLIEEQQLTKFNIGIEEKPQMVKVSSQL